MSGIEIRPSAAALGAEVKCGDLSKLDDAGRAAVRQAWLEHLVLVFRDQQLDDPALVDVARIFGEPEVAAVAPANGVFQEIVIVSNVKENGKPIGALGAGELLWHSDHSFNERPLGAAMLFALEVPPAGGDTSFCNMYRALETLPAELRARIEGLTIKNDGTYNSAGIKRADIPDVEDLTSYPGPSHPILRTHADTGRNVLYLGRRPNAYINGLPVPESEALLDALWAHCRNPDLHWTHCWRPGDLVVWDNRSVMHRRSAFDDSARRVMHRAQCHGERPYFSPAGEAQGLPPGSTATA